MMDALAAAAGPGVYGMQFNFVLAGFNLGVNELHQYTYTIKDFFRVHLHMSKQNKDCR